VRRVEEQMEGGEALSANKTKVSFSKGATMKSTILQRKESLLFTNEETKGQKESAEVAFNNQVEQACFLSHIYHFMHTELAKLVVDVECRGSRREPNASLGQERKQEAHLSIGGVPGESQLQNGEDEAKVVLSNGRKNGQRKTAVAFKQEAQSYLIAWKKDVDQAIG